MNESDMPYVYNELNWGSDVKRNNDNLIWRYWVAKEIADDIVSELSIKEMPEKGNVDWWNIIYKIIWETPLILHLTQLLKKEWFR